MKILFITIAGNAVGYGHLSRCLALAEQALGRGVEASFLLFGDTAAASRVNLAGYTCRLIPISQLSCELNASVLHQIEKTDAAVVDFSHAIVLANLDVALDLMEHIRTCARHVVVLDGLREQALATNLPDMPIDVLVTPYVTALPQAHKSCWRILTGPEYAPLSAKYVNFPTRTAHKIAERVLISCGGSDPTALTPVVLEGLKALPISLDVRVVIGPLFSQGLVKQLKQATADYSHSITFVYAPDELTLHMLWCDLAITTSGLTKYELAATATPAVLMSIDAVHDAINQPFARLGTAVDLGFEVTPDAVAEYVKMLMDQSEVRAAMMKAGRKIVDGRGAERLIDDILRSCCVNE